MSYKILNFFPEFVVVFKPAGMLSVPARDSNDPRQVLGKLLELELNRQIFPVHRLDFEVAGIMLYALTPSMHKILSLGFEHQKIHKTYLAIAERHSQNFELQEWKSLLIKGKKRTFEAPYGKASLTHAQTLENLTFNAHKISRWKLSPLTGRSHQLRYEMMKHQHVILGDTLYGSTLKRKENQISLVSIQITLPLELTQPPHNLPALFTLGTDQIDQALSL